MKRQSSILDVDGSPFQIDERQSLEAYAYDALNRRGETDGFKYANTNSGNFNDTPYVRHQLAALARHEFQNNSYCRGAGLKIAHEVVGESGPRLEIEPESNTSGAKKAANIYEGMWQEWADETNFVDRLLMGVIEEMIGGEVFAMFRINNGLSTVPVDFEQYEGIQFQSTAWHRALWDGDREYPIVDGIRMDRRGNVRTYFKLRQHPGSNHFANLMGSVDEIPSDIIVHMYRKERPSQYRGVSHLAPCVEKFNHLRRFADSTLESAENFAKMMGFIETAFQPNLCAPGDGPIEIPIGNGHFMTLPDGWKASYARPEQPTITYGDFVKAVLHEIISCLLIPWNVASGDSSDFNFASGQLDHRIFERVIKFLRKRQERRLVNRFFKFWNEFAMFGGFIPPRLGPFKWRWYWPETKPIDPNKVANANKTKKEAGLLDETAYWQERGQFLAGRQLTGN